MSSPSTPTLSATSAAPAAATPRLSAADIDRSCAWPVMTLWLMALCWLLFGSVLAIVAAIKLHAPGFLAAFPWLTYGRVQPVAWHSFVYGFGLQAGLGFALWLTARLSAQKLSGARGIILAAVCWNFGLKLGILGLLLGEGTGIEALELPGFAWPILLGAYLGVASWAIVTFHRRVEKNVFISQWYILGALFSFPWLYGAANLLAVYAPVRGVLQAAVQAWYLHNLLLLWFTFLGLAALFYFIPKLTGNPVPSRNLAVFGFWTLALFGGFGGLQRYLGGPFPAWMLSTAVVATVLTLIPVLAVAINLSASLRGQAAKIKASPVLWFIAVAAASYLITAALGIANSFAIVRRTTHFTLFTVGLDQLTLQGCFGMAMFGAIYYLAPRLTGRQWPFPSLVTFHFRCAAVALTLSFLALVVGGIVHGNAMNDPSLPFFLVAKGYLPFASTVTLANLIWLLGNAALALNLLRLLATLGRESCAPAVKAWFRVSTPAAALEVKA